ncbi:siderophore-interacting protein [Brevibacterium yomogidense]|uniref:siderophore-interacting protein n=1 Tax=Brevibacterium yomogidense TaxID=946573 RepID=UPI0018DFBCB0|nr:siderophore-interacting protein [Brevibacterium yomogidense]
MTDRPRPPRPQHVMEVVERSQLSPSLVRLVVGGPGFSTFPTPPSIDAYVKIVFAKPELGLEPPYDLAHLRETLPREDIPVTRTYTVREVDETAGTLTLDFVVHGDEGLAAPWARDAQPGDPIVFMGPGGTYSPDPTADWHLLAGDLSALPAVGAALEALPADARGYAFLVVDEDGDRIDLTAPAGVEIVWAVGSEGGAATDLLATTMQSRTWPDGRVHVFAHGERESIKRVRALLKEREVPRDQISISGYWAYGRNEDRFQSEKREPVGKID